MRAVGSERGTEAQVDLNGVICDRRSVRSFTGDEIPRDVLDEVFRLAGQAPSSANAQPWRFHVASGETRGRVGPLAVPYRSDFGASHA